MKRINQNKFLVTPLHSVVLAVSPRKQSIFSTQYLYTSCFCLGTCMTAADSSYAFIISLSNDFSTTIQLPK
jgi:hypothetical protein